MTSVLAGSPTTADPIDALLGPAPGGTTPIEDMRAALGGRLGLVLLVLAVALVAWLVYRSHARRKQHEWRQRVMIRSIASRGFALYRGASATPGTRVDALTPSWPVAHPQPGAESTLPAPKADELQPPPWATWVRASRG